jgi:hypothetical protein
MPAKTGLAQQQAPAVLLASATGTGPGNTGIKVVQVTSAATVHVDLQAAFGLEYTKRFLSITSGEKMFYLCSSGATDAVNKTSVAGDTQADMLAANERREGYAPARYLHIIADNVTDYVRMYISSP